MAHYKRRRPRTSPPSGHNDAAFPNGTPQYWRIMWNTRPARRRQDELLGRIERGIIDPDAATFYDVGRKPHCYYW